MGIVPEKSLSAQGSSGGQAPLPPSPINLNAINSPKVPVPRAAPPINNAIKTSGQPLPLPIKGSKADFLSELKRKTSRVNLGIVKVNKDDSDKNKKSMKSELPSHTHQQVASLPSKNANTGLTDATGANDKTIDALKKRIE